jgi:hypothetical protein
MEIQCDRRPAAEITSNWRHFDLDLANEWQLGQAMAMERSRLDRLDDFADASGQHLAQARRRSVQARRAGKKERLGQQQLAFERLNERGSAQVQMGHRRVG